MNLKQSSPVARIDDVARRAGVSPSTVSYVLSGRRKISEPTRQRVQRAIEDLNYRPHAGARALASSQTNVIALLAPLRAGVDVNVLMQFVVGIISRAREFDKDVLMLTERDADGVDRLASGSMADAFIVMDIERDDLRLPSLRDLGKPAVLIGVPNDSHGLPFIDFDFEGAGHLAIRHLADSGRKNVVLIGSPRAVIERGTTYALRLRNGAEDEAASLGLELRSLACDPSPQAAAVLVEDLLLANPHIDSIVVHNEAALPGVIASLKNSGRRVPGDVEVIAVGPEKLLGRQLSPVTVVDLPGEQIGRAAVEMVIDLQAGRPAVNHLVNAEMLFKCS